MTFTEILILVNGLLLVVVGFFLRDTMTRLKTTESNTIKNSNDIDLIKQEHSLKHEFITERFVALTEQMRALTNEIKELNKKLEAEK